MKKMSMSGYLGNLVTIAEWKKKKRDFSIILSILLLPFKSF